MLLLRGRVVKLLWNSPHMDTLESLLIKIGFANPMRTDRRFFCAHLHELMEQGMIENVQPLNEAEPMEDADPEGAAQPDIAEDDNRLKMKMAIHKQIVNLLDESGTRGMTLNAPRLSPQPTCTAIPPRYVRPLSAPAFDPLFGGAAAHPNLMVFVTAHVMATRANNSGSVAATGMEFLSGRMQVLNLDTIRLTFLWLNTICADSRTVQQTLTETIRVGMFPCSVRTQYQLQL
ncbi:hypothetical protein A0H81_01594 [Grifola frondosa]|uniref:Uncharacterized protein n=1 Tax=Grifola frondosa TaxID=5627 RepID=A0A1C7MNU4_GRIFR|nr:hypothetical protein A0H81_01594 [Grifola frondosa]